MLAWTPSTKGTVSTDAVHIVPPTGPTQAELDAWIAEMTPKIKGKIVLVGAHTTVPVDRSTSPPLRRDDEELRRQLDPNAPPHGRARRTRPRRRSAGPADAATNRPIPRG